LSCHDRSVDGGTESPSNGRTDAGNGQGTASHTHDEAAWSSDAGGVHDESASSLSDPRVLKVSEIVRPIRGAYSAFRRCYEQILSTSDYRGRMRVQFTVGAEGRATESCIAFASAPPAAAADGHVDTLGRCVLAVFDQIQFPAFATPRTFSYPFIFRPEV
jgi:hypothetical protein